MALNIEISDVGRENVVSRGYLHSSTFNFRNAVAITKETSRFNMNENYYQEIERKLIEMKEKLQSKENDFYLMFGINTGDSSKNAYQFNKLFGKSIQRYKVIQKLNTEEFLKMSDKNLTNIIQKVVLKFEGICNDQNINIERILDPYDFNSFMEESLKALNRIYPLILNENKNKKSLRKAILKSGKINDKIEVRFGEIFKKEFPDQVNKISDQSSQEFLNNILLYLQPDEEFAKIIKKSFNKIKNKLNLNTYERNNRIGIIGEIQAQMFLDLLLDSISDNAPKSFYVGNLYDSKTKKQSPIDFLVGKYGIQIKNTMEAIENSTIKPFYDVKVQSDISLDNFISRLNRADAQEFKYLIANVSWLRNNGLNKNEEFDKLKFNDIPMILEYINNILNSYSEQLLHTEASKVINKEGKTLKNSYGNTFFLLKGEYLIPISIMIDGIIEALRLENQKDSSGVGFFYRNDLGINNKKGKTVRLNSATNLENAVSIHHKKIDILSSMAEDSSLNPNEFDYSGELLDYGSSLTDDLVGSMNIRIKYKFITENLNKISNNLKLW